MFNLGPEFQCKPGSVSDLMEFELMKSDNGMMGKITTVRGRWLDCSRKCYINARCHGFKSYTSYSGDVCELWDYYPLPEKSMVVEGYYQLHCV